MLTSEGGDTPVRKFFSLSEQIRERRRCVLGVGGGELEASTHSNLVLHAKGEPVVESLVSVCVRTTA